MKQTFFLLFIFSFLIISCSDEEFAPAEAIAESKSTADDIPRGGLSNIPDTEEPKTPPQDPKDPDDPPLPPKVLTPGTVTILIALGDIVNNGLVVKEASAQLLAESAVSYASPVTNPKVLVIKDHNHNGESKYDTEYIRETLLKKHHTEILYETNAGIAASDLEGYDLVWFNNPGHPMGSKKTMEALIEFSGGVILSGDDLTRGKGFVTKPLTGLQYVDNGTRISCSNGSFNMDNNNGHQYEIKVNNEFFDLNDESILSFKYGNDIDNSLMLDNTDKYEVLAYAFGETGTCEAKRPAIVRYKKDVVKTE